MRRQTGRGRAPKQPVSAPPPPDVQFPLMTVGEIMDDMQQFEYPLDASVIKNPKTNDVYEIYSFFMRELYGPDIDRELQPDPNATQNYEYPDLFPSVVLSRLHFIKSLRKMFEEACYYDFSVSDLEAPEAMRFRYQLSALVNYAKYRRSRHETMHELAIKEDEVTSRHEELSMGLEKLNAEISAIEAARLEEQPQVDEHQRITKELFDDHKALDEKRVELTKYTGERKMELNELKERVAELEKKQIQTQSEVVANKRLIVESPERAIAEIKELENELKRAKVAVKAARDTRSAYESRREILHNAVEPLRTCANIAEKISSKRNQVTEFKQRLAKGHARERRAQDAIHEAESEIARIQRATDAIVARRERLEQVMVEHERKASAGNKAWTGKLDEIRVFEADCERERVILRKQIETIVRDMTAFAQKAQSDMRSMVEEHEKMKNASQLHKQQIKEAMDMFTKDGKEAFGQLSEMAHRSEDSK